MNILFLTDNFPPEFNAPASRTFEHCREWTRLGHKVTVVTCAPNFPKGQVFPGYKNKLWQSEVIDGIRVIRVWTYITANEGFVRRILDYLSFMLMGFLASLFVRGQDIVIGTSPQFFTACAAWAVSKVKRIPWIFELRDLWPESIKAVGAMNNGRVIGFLEKLELALYRSANRIVSVTHTFKTTLINRGIDGRKIDVITNGVDSSRFAPMAKDAELVRELGLEDAFVAGYIGTHGMAHALETVLEAAAQLQAGANGQKFKFIFLGDGACKAQLKKSAEEAGLHNVLFLDSVAKDQVARYWSLLDASIIHLKDTELFTSVIPSKMFECMGMGIPVLQGVRGESADIVRREGVGEVFEPENSQALAACLLRLSSDPALREQYKANGIAAAKLYDRQHLAKVMLDCVQRPVTEARGRKAGVPAYVLEDEAEVRLDDSAR